MVIYTTITSITFNALILIFNLYVVQRNVCTISLIFHNICNICILLIMLSNIVSTHLISWLPLFSFYIYTYFRIYWLFNNYPEGAHPYTIYSKYKCIRKCINKRYIITIVLLSTFILKALLSVVNIVKYSNSIRTLLLILSGCFMSLFCIITFYPLYCMYKYILHNRVIYYIDPTGDMPTIISQHHAYSTHKKKALFANWIRINKPKHLHIPSAIVDLCIKYFQDLNYIIQETRDGELWESYLVRRNNGKKIELQKKARFVLTIKIIILIGISMLLLNYGYIDKYPDMYLFVEIFTVSLQHNCPNVLEHKIFYCLYYIADKWFSLQAENEGCFDGNGLVLMANGTRKKICELRIGDKVRSFSDYVSEIKYCVSIDINREISMVKLYNYLNDEWCWITFEHPVLVCNNNDFNIDVNKCLNIGHILDTNIVREYDLKWVIPKEIWKKEYRFQNKVYNFILNRNHTLNVNGYWCCTLGHNLKGETIEHPFWGNYDVITEFLHSNDMLCNVYHQLK
eukprot:282016_1